MVFLFDGSKPPEGTQQNPSPPVSGDLRANSGALQESGSGKNWIRDNGLLIWAGGDAVAPTHYSVQNGAGAAIARETTNKYKGFVAAKLTGATAASEYLQQQLLSVTTFLPELQGQYFSFGCAIDCDTAASAKIGIYDGIGTTWSSEHAGSGGYAWFTVKRLIDDSADRLIVRMQVAQGIVAYFAGMTVWKGSVEPHAPDRSPCGIYLASPGTQQGDIAAATNLNGWRDVASLPWIVGRTVLKAGTGPATQAAIYDVNKNGSSMYGTRPQIAAAASDNLPGAVPDGTYANRCLDQGDILTIDCDQVGVGTTGADVTAKVAGLCFPHIFQSRNPALLAETGAE